MRTILLMLMLLPVLAMAQTEKEITETWLAAELGAAGEGEKATLLKQATVAARADLQEFVKDSYAGICTKRDAYEKDPAALAKAIDRINEEWHQRRLAHYKAIRNQLNVTEEARFDSSIEGSIAVHAHDGPDSYSELLATGRTTVPQSLDRICGEEQR